MYAVSGLRQAAKERVVRGPSSSTATVAVAINLPRGEVGLSLVVAGYPYFASYPDPALSSVTYCSCPAGRCFCAWCRGRILGRRQRVAECGEFRELITICHSSAELHFWNWKSKLSTPATTPRAWFALDSLKRDEFGPGSPERT